MFYWYATQNEFTNNHKQNGVTMTNLDYAIESMKKHLIYLAVTARDAQDVIDECAPAEYRYDVESRILASIDSLSASLQVLQSIKS